jgi:hypothetical protein
VVVGGAPAPWGSPPPAAVLSAAAGALAWSLVDAVRMTVF